MNRRRVSVGQRYGHLVVKSIVPGTKDIAARAVVACDCGTEKTLVFASLYRGKCKSCGCKRADFIRQNKTTHGHSSKLIGKSKEYMIWVSVKNRCTNPNDKSYRKYGARGIAICPEWRHSFEQFLRDVGRKPSPSHSLDRIDPRGPYAPWNCRWASPKEQRANQIPAWPTLMNAVRHGFYGVRINVRFSVEERGH